MEIDYIISHTPIEYEYALDTMHRDVELIATGQKSSYIWILEHPHIYTAGISASDSDLLSHNIPVFKIDRGGKYTYHGPGQMVIYLMINLKELFDGKQDLRLFIKLLEEWVITIMHHLGINAFVRENRIGVWVSVNGLEKKIAALGIKVRKWVSYHGIAINYNTDLSYFNGIIPCGIKEYGVTSMHEIGIDPADLSSVALNSFVQVFDNCVLRNGISK